MAEPTNRPGPLLDRRLGHLAVVWLGGSLGTAARFGIGRASRPVAGLPWSTLIINIVGAFLLGLLLGRLARGGDVGPRRVVRLLLGTGLLGGFTTYSTLAVDTTALFGAGRPGGATAYALVTVVLGGLAAAGGLALGGVGRRTERTS